MDTNLYPEPRRDEHVDTLERDEALSPHVGTGTPSTAPHEPPAVSLLAGQPAAVIGTAVAVADALLVAAVPLPEWLTTVLIAVVTLAGALGIRSRVTPTARPRLDSDTPLTP